MYGLPQAGFLAQFQLIQHLRTHGYHQTIADKIYSGEYSFGESIILLRHRRERESAISLSTPGMNSSVKLKSDNAMYHRTIIGFEASLKNNKFL